jgi:FtsP/CotA-like multicopper oxidase with cupredoxin domain
MKLRSKLMRLSILLAILFLLSPIIEAGAVIDGVSGTTTFDFTARADHLRTGDGGSPLFWGYAYGTGRAQYPGPTLIVNQGETITISLKNALPVPGMNVSLVFPGQEGVIATGGIPGIMTHEAPPDGTTVVTYTFQAMRPGTFVYHSGTKTELQIEMGLVGALIVRPTGFDPAAPTAYGDPASSYHHEYLFLLSEMDPYIHDTVEFAGIQALEATNYLDNYFPNWWFINGRNAMDTMGMAGDPWLPTQPYNCMPRMHPGERLLMRVIGAGRDLHPFHHHGNHALVIARDGRLIESAAGSGPDLAHPVFTIQSVPGETVDAIFEWTGRDMGWDIYGTGPEHEHSCNGISVNAADPASAGFDPVTNEYCPDHGKPLPVILPQQLDLVFGGFWGGSPYLGVMGSLPPGEGGLNPNAGFAYMWHSHTEKEMTNFDIFPGGMMTMLIIEPPGVPIP